LFFFSKDIVKWYSVHKKLVVYQCIINTYKHIPCSLEPLFDITYPLLYVPLLYENKREEVDPSTSYQVQIFSWWPPVERFLLHRSFENVYTIGFLYKLVPVIEVSGKPEFVTNEVNFCSIW
jgi:hypothetical protein